MPEVIDSFEEIWRDVEGYEGRYMVSSWGNVKSLRGRGRILRPQIDIHGYFVVNLCQNSIPKTMRIHRLVANAFIPNPENLPCINHLDEVKANNKVENLEWCTYSHNINWGTRTQRVSQKLAGSNCTQNAVNERSRAVMQFSRDGKYIATFNSTQAAGRAVTGRLARNRDIVRCCQRKRPTAYGFVWRYVDENGGGTKPVAQVDENGNIIRRFPSVRCAAEEYKISYSGVAMCCQGYHKTTHGLRFIYLPKNSP